MWKTHLETKQERTSSSVVSCLRRTGSWQGGLNQGSAYLVGPAGLEPATKGL